MLEETKKEQHADSTYQQTMYENYKEENVDKNYPEKIAECGHTTNNGPPNKGVPSVMETPDIARRPTVSETASEMGKPDVKVVPGARRSTMPKAANEEVVPGDAALMRKEPNVRHSIATHKYEQTKDMEVKMETERSAITATTPEEGRTGGHS